MPVAIDHNRGCEVAERLHRAFATTGILGRTAGPEDQLPQGMESGSLEHLLFITLSVAIDYQRDANQLWASARASFEDSATHYLFDPQALKRKPPEQVAADMQRHRLSRKPQRDACIWRTIGVTLHTKWGGDPCRFLAACGWHALRVLERLKADTHLEHGIKTSDFPNLRGNKIGPLWLRMLRDNVGITKLTHLDGVPIPVDIHVARATLTTGVVRGEYRGNLGGIFPVIRQAWFESVAGLEVKNRPMMALDVDEPLWHLSKYGCKDRTERGGCRHLFQCEARGFCTPGPVQVAGGEVRVRTCPSCA